MRPCLHRRRLSCRWIGRPPCQDLTSLLQGNGKDDDSHPKPNFVSGFAWRDDNHSASVTSYFELSPAVPDNNDVLYKGAPMRARGGYRKSVIPQHPGKRRKGGRLG